MEHLTMDVEIDTAQAGAACTFSLEEPGLTPAQRRAEERRALLHRSFDEIWNEGNLNAFDEFYAAGIVRRQPPMPVIEGVDAYKQYAASVLQTYPDFRTTVEEVIIEGETSVARYTMRGTQTEHNAILDLAPTGNPIEVTATTTARWADDKIVEEWANIDYLGLYQQLGIVPTQNRN